MSLQTAKYPFCRGDSCECRKVIRLAKKIATIPQFCSGFATEKKKKFASAGEEGVNA